MKNRKLPTLFNTPLRLIIALGLFILVVELFIMTVIQDAFISLNLPDVYWQFFDAILLTIIISPVLYSLIFQKLQSEERLRQINASAQDAIVIVNEQGRFTDWNPAAQKMFQYRREEALGLQMHQLLAPSRYHADVARGFAHFQKTGDGPLIGKTWENVAIRKDGSEFPVEISLSALKVRDSWHAVGVIRDITERKRAEERIFKNEAQIKAVLESLTESVVVLDTSGTVVSANDAATRLFGRTLEELIDPETDPRWKIVRSDGSLFPVEEQPAIVALRTGVPVQNVEMGVPLPDGTFRWVLVNAQLMRDISGTTMGVVASSFDITERKQAEAKIDEQLNELRRWYDATLGQGMRNIELKREINELLIQAGQPPRYPSAEPEEWIPPIV